MTTNPANTDSEIVAKSDDIHAERGEGGETAAAIAESPTPTDSPENPVAMPFRQFLFYWLIALILCAGAAELWRQWSPTSGGSLMVVLLFALTGTAAFSDAATRKIPNRFSYSAIITALILTLLIAPIVEIADWKFAVDWLGFGRGASDSIAAESLKGFAFLAIFGVISFAMRGLGGGDVKVLAAVGALAGWQISLSIFLNTLLVAFAFGVINFIFRGVLFANLQTLLVRIYGFIFMRNFSASLKFTHSESPFCLSLFFGIALLHYVNLRMWLGEFLPFLR